MNTIIIDKRKGFVEVNYNTNSFHLGERPLILRDAHTDFGVNLIGFGLRFYLAADDVVLINGKSRPDTIEQLTNELFNLFN